MLSSAARTRSASASSNASAATWLAVKGRSPSRGQAASSSASYPFAPAQDATSSRLRSGMQALRKPSFIAATAAWAAATSTHSPLAADASTASVMRVARRPSANSGRPSGAWPVSTAS